MKKINLLFNIIIAAGIFLIIGTAGGSDTGMITVSEIFTFTISGASLIGIGYAGKVFVNKLIPQKTRAHLVVRRTSAKRYTHRDMAA